MALASATAPAAMTVQWRDELQTKFGLSFEIVDRRHLEDLRRRRGEHAVAGGFTYRGVQDYASVVRTTGNDATEGLVTPPSFIAPGDVIKVFERRF